MTSFYKGSVEQEAFRPIYESAIKELNRGLQEVKAETVKAQGAADRAGTNADIATDASNEATTTLTVIKGIKADIDSTANTVGSIASQVTNDATQVAKDRVATATYSSNALTSQNAAKVSETNAKQSEVICTNAVVTTTQNRDECAASATAASISESKAASSEGIASEAARKSQEIYEAFAKGAVYRGGWNPSTQVYPNAQNINSYWDVYLDNGLTEYDWNGIKWFSGDRLIYSQPDNQYFHISRVSGVITVNGRGGNVVITADELNAVKYDAITGSASLPKGATNQRTANPTGGEIRFNSELKEFEGFDTKEWGTIGGGGVPKFIDKATSFTVANRSAYKVSMLDGTSKTVTVPTGLDNNSWFAISTVDWKRDSFGYFVTINFGTDVISNGEIDANTLKLDTPCTVYFQKINGKWSIVDGVGTDGNYGNLEKRVEKLESYPTEWKVVKSVTDSNAVYFPNPSVLGNNGSNETSWRWLDENAIQITGIIRVVTDITSNALALRLPAGLNVDMASCYLPCTIPYQARTVYFSSLNSRDISITITGGTLAKSQWAMVNWTIPVRKI